MFSRICLDVGVSGLNQCKQGHRTNVVTGGGFCYLHKNDGRGAEYHNEDVFFSFFMAEVKA